MGDNFTLTDVTKTMPTISADQILEMESAAAEARKLRIADLLKLKADAETELKKLGYTGPKVGRPRGSRNKRQKEQAA